MDRSAALLPWFGLKSVPGVGNLLFKRLIAAFNTPEAVLAAAPDSLAAVDGVSSKLARTIAGHRMTAAAAKDLDRALSAGYDVVVLTDPDYPPLLREIADPPALLFVSGSLAGAAPAVAVVGSRHPTDYGTRTTWRLSRDLAMHGFTVVSGLARGIDTAAHEGALDGDGRTVAVLGSGLDRIYPGENRNLAERIAATGAVISEFAPDAEPEAHHFPIRNRIISGMCLGTMIAEATLRSGSLITARLAAEQGREVFAVPGSIHSHKSTGTHTLIKQGAKLVEHAGDVIEELAPMHEAPAESAGFAAPPPAHELTPEEARVCAELTAYPVHIDELGRRLSMEPSRLSGLLLGLELKGLARQLPGKMFAAAEIPHGPT